MNADDFSKVLGQNDHIIGQQDGREKLQQDFDDISSIYTAHGLQSNIEKTMNRVQKRDKFLDTIDDQDYILIMSPLIDLI